MEYSIKTSEIQEIIITINQEELKEIIRCEAINYQSLSSLRFKELLEDGDIQIWWPDEDNPQSELVAKFSRAEEINRPDMED